MGAPVFGALALYVAIPPSGLGAGIEPGTYSGTLSGAIANLFRTDTRGTASGEWSLHIASASAGGKVSGSLTLRGTLDTCVSSCAASWRGTPETVAISASGSGIGTASGADAVVTFTARVAASPTPVTYTYRTDSTKTGTDAFAPESCLSGQINLQYLLAHGSGLLAISCAAVPIRLTLHVVASPRPVTHKGPK